MARSAVMSIMIALWLLASAWGAWIALATVSYGFPMFYDMAGIGDAVKRFGPQNRYKRDFEKTDRAEHERLFDEIARAINQSGHGLSELRYQAPDGSPIDIMLREPEVEHLQDVANLVDRLRVAAYVCTVALVGLVGLAAWRRWQLPSLARIVLGAVAGSVAIGLGVTLYGAEALFYQWHTAVFPEGHQWFFYYQDSLMTTLMRAPVIFGYIGALLVVVTLLFFALGLSALRALLRAASARGRAA